MRTKNKKNLLALLIIGFILIVYASWLSLRPVEIVATHDNGNHSYILVKSFPFTDQGKINWWLKNNEMLKSKYKIPKPASYGSFTIIFWLFGDGYKEEGKYDRLCFEDMKTKVNCIEKNAIFSVSYSKNMGTMFTVYDGTYQMKKNGDIVKYNY